MILALRHGKAGNSSRALTEPTLVSTAAADCHAIEYLRAWPDREGKPQTEGPTQSAAGDKLTSPKAARNSHHSRYGRGLQKSPCSRKPDEAALAITGFHNVPSNRHPGIHLRSFRSCGIRMGNQGMGFPHLDLPSVRTIPQDLHRYSRRWPWSHGPDHSTAHSTAGTADHRPPTKGPGKTNYSS